MKLLLDSCVSGGVRAVLETAGHDVTLAAPDGPDPGDAEILSRAHSQGRVVVTIDKDFGELAVRYGAPHAGIVRLVGFRGSEQAVGLLRALESHADDRLAGAILTVEPGRVRVRR